MLQRYLVDEVTTAHFLIITVSNVGEVFQFFLTMQTSQVLAKFLLLDREAIFYSFVPYLAIILSSVQGKIVLVSQYSETELPVAVPL
jgi:hypothetical protein